MTRYLFEDRICNRHTLFIMSKYTYNEHTVIHFADDGVSTLLSYIELLINNYGNINIIVFMDLPMYNQISVSHYNTIRYRAKDYIGNIIVIPFPCLEYYFIKAYSSIGLGTDSEAIDCVLNFTDYKHTDMYLNKIKSAKQKKTWEKFSKMVLRLGFQECFDNKSSNGEIFFFSNDCKCCSLCNLSYEEKVYLLFKHFECMPYGSLIKEMNACSLSEVYTIHKRMVDRYNNIVRDRFCSWVFKEGQRHDVGDYTVEYFPEPKNL